MAETTPEDLIVVVDSRDEPIGAIPRAELGHHPGLQFRTSHVFVFDREQRLLLQQLAARRDRNPLRWGSSVAAYVRPGETYRGAAQRRCKEELGLDLALDRVGKTEMQDLGGIKHISLFAAGQASHDVIVKEPEHIADLEWVDLEDVRRLVDEEPARFTETFLWLVHRFYGDTERRSAAGG